MSKQNQQVMSVAERAAQLDAIASQAALAFLSPTQNVAMALQLAEGIEQMRELFDTPEIKQRIVSLQDSRLGFRTDRDPKIRNRKTGQPNEPYPWDVVRECALEALLRGVTLCGNQFNIIATGSYITKEGYLWKLSKVPGFADFKPMIGVPQAKAGGAIVHCEATWTLNGKAGNLAVDIAAKGDDYTGVDGYVGKAERKFFKRVYEIVSGRVGEPDGDVDERPALPALSDVPGPTFLEYPKQGPVQRAKPQPAPTDTMEAQPEEAAAVNSTPQQQPPAPGFKPTLVESPLSIQEQLQARLMAEGYTMNDLAQWGESTGNIPDGSSYATFEDMPLKIAERLLRNVNGLLRGLAAGKEGAK
jgi:hypothetical protein